LKPIFSWRFSKPRLTKSILTGETALILESI